MEIDSSFIAFPAHGSALRAARGQAPAATHLSTAPKSGRNAKALPMVADPRRGTMDPCLRGCNPIEEWLDQRPASFDASLREAPQESR
jgi:hypothetical protein